jgi:molybdenum cofactor biosynthesis enzyme MoaA
MHEIIKNIINDNEFSNTTTGINKTIKELNEKWRNGLSLGDNIELKYATNGTTLGIKGGRTIHDYWPHFKSVAVNVSVDGINDVYNYIRGNGDWNQVVENIKEIQKIPNVSRIVGAVAVQVSNVLSLDEMITHFLDELGIVFYTNIVKYPNVLSVQVLPKYLKILAVQRLNAVKDHVPKFRHVRENPILLDLTLKQIDGIINYINATDQSDKWEDCIEFNRRLDKTRDQSFEEVTPEFKRYV